MNQALLRIARRAESADRHSVAQSFVGVGSLSAMLQSTDHQIVYGRRGTGKTHALLYVHDLIQHAGDVAVYVDLRTLGSAGGLYADASVNAAHRATQLVVDTLEAIHEGLLTVAFERTVTDQDGLLTGLDAWATAASTVEVVGEVERETTIEGAAATDRSSELKASLGDRTSQVGGSVSSSRQESMSAASRWRRSGVEQHQVVFGPLSRALRTIVHALHPTRLWLLLDEWSSIPTELQPVLADVLRRGVLPVPGATVKIASVERRSRFLHWQAFGDYVGIEVGADAASAVNLDDFLVFDHSHSRAQWFFQQLFYNHAASQLPPAASDARDSSASFIRAAFSKNAFAELVRAAEGVPRDAINIAAVAAQHAHDQSITVAHIRAAAQQWYLRDKYQATTTNQAAIEMLRRLVDEVVGRRRQRSFLLEHHGDAQDERIQDLYDARLLHMLRRGIINRAKPGTHYDAFAIDYGCYAALLQEGSIDPGKTRDSWLASPRGAQAKNVNLQRSVIDLTALHDRNP